MDPIRTVSRNDCEFPGRSQLFNQRTTQCYRDSMLAGVERVAERFAKADRPATGITPAELAPDIDVLDLDRPARDVATALDELERIYLRDAVYFHHPRYLAHLNCPVVIPALLAEAVLTAVNSSLDTWDQSAGATLIERRIIGWTADRAGLPGTADGVFTSGGTQSNLQALLIARQEALRAAPGTSPDRLRILASEVSHFSVTRAAELLGMPASAVVTVPCDDRRRMRPDALAAALADCRAAGAVPVAVVATAGTTDFGSIDPLPQTATICRTAGVWLHVDAAYGCGLLVSPTHRHLLAGLQHADSLTVDYHKSFFQPVSASAVLVRDPETLRHVRHHADYLNPKRHHEAGIPNQVDKSLQTTRRFDALKVWLTLRVMGADALGRLFDQVIERAEQGWRLLDADDRFEVLVRPQLSTLVFRYRPATATEQYCDHANLHARAALAASGEAVVAGTVAGGRHYLKFTLLNPETTEADIAAVLDLIAHHAESQEVR